jgi:hypothetical protein
LVSSGQEPIGFGGNREWEIISQFHLREKDIESITRFHSQPGKNFLSSTQTAGRNASTEQNRRGHRSKMLKNAPESIALSTIQG